MEKFSVKVLAAVHTLENTSVIEKFSVSVLVVDFNTESVAVVVSDRVLVIDLIIDSVKSSVSLNTLDMIFIPS